MSAATVMRSYGHMLSPGLFPQDPLPLGNHFKWGGSQWMDTKGPQPQQHPQQQAEPDYFAGLDLGFPVVKAEQGLLGLVTTEPKSVLDLRPSPGNSPNQSDVTASGAGTSAGGGAGGNCAAKPPGGGDDLCSWVNSMPDLIGIQAGEDPMATFPPIVDSEEQQAAQECGLDFASFDMAQFGMHQELSDCIMDTHSFSSPSDSHSHHLKHSASFSDFSSFDDAPPLRRTSTFPDYQQRQQQQDAGLEELVFPHFSRLLDTHFIDSHSFQPQANPAITPKPAESVLRQVIAGGEEEQLVALRPTQERLVPTQPLVQENPGLVLVHLLLACAEAINECDDNLGRDILPRLLDHASPYGDPMQRIAIYFGEALRELLDKRRAALLFHQSQQQQQSQQMQQQQQQQQQHQQQQQQLQQHQQQQQEEMGSRMGDQNVPGSSLDHDLAYQAMYQVLPFIKFAQFTGNQAILDAVGKRDKIHIIDFDIKQGLQWPGLIQSLAVRQGGPPELKLTGIGTDARVLALTGRRLADFADSLNVRLHFKPVVEKVENLHPLLFDLEGDEGLAVNCPTVLHRLLPSQNMLDKVLRMVMNLQPAVVTLLEVEGAPHNSSFISRFVAALHYYSAMFDSLEATLERDSTERLRIESLCLANEIRNILVCDGQHVRTDVWRSYFHRAGFTGLSLSEHALYQAKLLLGLYSSSSYKLNDDGYSATLGWQDIAVVAVSAWRPPPHPVAMLPT